MYQKGVSHVARFLWDFDSSNSQANSSAATGTIPIFSAPANSVIKGVRARVETAVTGSTAEEVGDAGDQDGFLVDAFAAAPGFYPPSAEHASCGAYQKATTAGATDAADVSRSEAKKLYSSATAINFVITGTATAGKIWFEVEFEQM